MTLDLSPGGRGRVNQAKEVGRSRGSRQREQKDKKVPMAGGGSGVWGPWEWRAGLGVPGGEWMTKRKEGKGREF